MLELVFVLIEKLTERILRALHVIVLSRKWTDLLWWTYLCIGSIFIQAITQLFGRVFLDPTLPLNIAFYECEISIYIVGVVFIICFIMVKRYLD